MFRFNVKKAIQAIALLLKQPGRDKSNYYKVIKLLYIAERESIQETGHSITGDRTVSMPHGPALSHTLDLIRGVDVRPEWSSFFKTKEKPHYILELTDDPGDESLCKYEIEKLKEVALRHKDHSWTGMKRITHDFLEFKINDPGKSSKDIPISDILDAAGKKRRSASVERIANADRDFARIFGE